MAKHPLWKDEYWLLLLQLYQKKPMGVKPLYSKGMVDLSLELHIAPEYLHEQMFKLRLVTPRIKRLWEHYGDNPKKLARQIRLLKDIKRVYRLAKQVDMDKYKEAKSREHGTMIQSRQIAKDLGLQMKIGDVEYQGDGNKAIFYYIADERVDFRQLIKVLAETFHVKIEMKQIGARQEAGRIGGTGPCGRELCCATWMKNFVSVGTTAARFQDISLNPQKLAGMCAKLKCCLNYEVDDYVEAGKKIPSREVMLSSGTTTPLPVLLTMPTAWSSSRKWATSPTTI